MHLLHREVFDEARSMGYELAPGDLGENVLTEDLDLLGLPTGTLLDLGGPVVRLRGEGPAQSLRADRRLSDRSAQGGAVPRRRYADRRAGPVDRLAGVRDRPGHSQGGGHGGR
ncbi:hypothetical protein CF8_4205 [Nocardioides sp. CF8]|nr:hypothetical protein CF8_4205 [Nocardioides sp. CF8]